VYIYVCYVYECALFEVIADVGILKVRTFITQLTVTLFTYGGKGLLNDTGRHSCVECLKPRGSYRGEDKPLDRPEGNNFGSMSGTRAISTTSRREISSILFSCKARRRRKFTPF